MSAATKRPARTYAIYSKTKRNSSPKPGEASEYLEFQLCHGNKIVGRFATHAAAFAALEQAEGA